MVESHEDEVSTIDDEIFSLPPPADDLLVSEYPDDFSGPFWRDNGAASIISKSLSEIKGILTKMIDEGRVVKKRLQAFYARYPFPLEDASPEEQDAAFDEELRITYRFWQLEHDLECCARTAILMAAIDLEACVNRFCYYNLGEATTEAIERLNPAGKLAVIHKILGLGDFKGTSQYQAVKALADWRDAFAHGKCTDMPANSLIRNHLSEPKNLPSSRDRVYEVLKLLHYYVVVYSHLNEISTHPYTKGDYHSDRGFIEVLLEDVQAFRFKDKFTVEKTNRW